MIDFNLDRTRRHAAAREGIAAAVGRFYREHDPALAAARAVEIEAAGRELGELSCLNVFPSMNVGWGSDPDYLGHEVFPGCFRCHDGEHATPDGVVISRDCSLCHTLLALEEESPAVLPALGR